MKTEKIIAWIAGLGAVVYLIKLVSPEPPPPPDKGKFNISSNPSSANAYVDEAYVGVTSVSVDVDAGTHTIRIVKSGYEDWLASKTINVGEIIDISATLTPDEPPPPGKGNLDGTVKDYDTRLQIEGAKVKINGYTVYTDSQGKYIQKNLPVGEHTLKASADGFYPDTKTGTVFDGKTTTRDFYLNPEMVAVGHFKIKVYDKSTGVQMRAAVRVEEAMHGIVIEKTTTSTLWTYFRDLPCGENYSVAATYPGFKTWHDTFTLYPNATTSRVVYLELK